MPARRPDLVRYTSLRLGRELGIEVRPAVSPKELADPALRLHQVTGDLASRGVLAGEIVIPNTAGALSIVADLRATQIRCSVELDAPREGRAQTRVRWLLRQLEKAPTELRLEAITLRQRGEGASGLLADVRQDPSVLIDDAQRDLRRFRLTLTRPLGIKRGQGQRLPRHLSAGHRR